MTSKPTAMRGEPGPVFAALKRLLAPHAARLSVRRDGRRCFLLDAGYSEKWRRTLSFGGVEARKRYVSYHLMPVYMYPGLLAGISPALRARMQGKSCFNFTRADPPLLEELGRLTRRGFDRFRKEGLLPVRIRPRPAVPARGRRRPGGR
jgi:hypothetical protein